MSKSTKKLRDDLIVLNTKIKDLATNLEDLYQNYFSSLSNVVKSQLILAIYQLCTQKYPDAFLRLTYQQRTKLQTDIKALDTIFLEDLWQNLQSIENINNEFLQNFYNNIITVISSSILRENQTQKNDNLIDNSEDSLSILKEINPEDLIKLQLDIDDCIEECLHNISNKANKYLQEANILPNKIPNKILEIALQAEENTSLVSGAPNLLSLLIEKEDTSDNLDITPITAICLRLREIEFNDSGLNLIRKKIINTMQNLDSLENQYQQLNQQYAIAQAESAWRSSWSEN